MTDVNKAKTEKRKKSGMILVMLFFVFLVLLGFVWKTYFWFDQKYDADITALCSKYQADKSLVYAVIKTESNFNENAVSKKGAAGLMQVMPDTAVFIAKELGLTSFSLKDGKQNLEFGVFYVSYLNKKIKDEKAVLAAYNAGETVVMRWLEDKKYSDDGQTLKSIPYPETEKYVKRASNFKKIYSKLY